MPYQGYATAGMPPHPHPHQAGMPGSMKRPYPGGGPPMMMGGGYPPRMPMGGRPPYGYGMPPHHMGGYFPPGMQPPFKKQKGGMMMMPGGGGGGGATPGHGKNAVMQLNEVKPGVEYKFVSQTGPVHSPIFKMEVEINGTVSYVTEMGSFQ